LKQPQPSKRIRKLILYTPHEKQLEFHSSPARFRVVAFGRQSGKSTACNNELLKKAWEKPGSTLWYVSPTYDSARIMFRRAEAALMTCRGVIDGDTNKSELMIPLINGSKIFYKSGDVFENLRTETLDGVVIDEVRNQKAGLWSLVLRPMLTTTKGWAAFISTPNGFDHFYDLFNFAQSDTTGVWASFQAPSTCNPLITEKELEDARRTMSEDQFAQEYLAQFRDLTQGKVAIGFGAHNLTSVNPFSEHYIHPQLPITVGLDFNVGHMAWTLMQKKADDYFAFDEIFIKDTNTQQASKVLVERLIKWHPHINRIGVVLAGDASGTARKTSASATDYDIVCQALDAAEIPWANVTGDANPRVIDKVNNLNAKLKDAQGVTHFWINPSLCPMLKKDMDRCSWKKNAEGVMIDQTSDPERSHALDSACYPLWWLSPLKYNTALPTLRVIYR
jgi:hypothetical protein